MAIMVPSDSESMIFCLAARNVDAEASRRAGVEEHVACVDEVDEPAIGVLYRANAKEFEEDLQALAMTWRSCMPRMIAKGDDHRTGN